MNHAEAGRRGGIVVAEKRRAAGVVAKEPLVPRPCTCCGQATKGGEFKMGHDAKFKSMLINCVLNEKTLVVGHSQAIFSPAQAIEELDRRGWRKFLEKKIEVLRTAPERQRAKNQTKQARKQEGVVEIVDGYQMMKNAAVRLKEIERYSGPNKIIVDGENSQFLTNATIEQIEERYPSAT
jgi:hypothetical protein